jgi:exodeoxyribonuclease VII large subunit
MVEQAGAAVEALSVAGVTEYIQLLLEDDGYLRQVWVMGEVSSTSAHRSGLFFALQDPGGKALINCVIWSSQLAKLTDTPRRGEQVIVLGSVKVYPGQGRYQLTVWQCLPGGAGLRAQRYQQLRNRLSAEGLFDPEVKLPLPPHPQTVAVVTSPQAAAWGDIQQTLTQRYPGLEVLLSPAVVQGDQAPSSIASAIARVQRDGRAEVLILARGGGATEDLACFNAEIVVRAIATCRIPVITGIGHQRDESLADLVADYCAHTPTAAAEQAVPALADLVFEHQDRVEALRSATHQALNRQHQRLQTLREQLSRVQPDKLLAQEQHRLKWIQQRLVVAMRSRMATAAQRQIFLREKWASLDPSSILKRGYAVVRAETGILRSGSQATVGQEVQIQLGEGHLTAQVTAVHPAPPG